MADPLKNRRLMEGAVPVKLSECRRLPVGCAGWGALTDYTLESVKVSRKCGCATSSAMLRVFDAAGHMSCIIKGQDVGLLFGLTRDQWSDVENLVCNNHQLFYRSFKNGLNEKFPKDQKMFYYFCHTCQKKDILFVEFVRSVSTRPIDRNGAFLQIVKVHNYTPHLLKLYDIGLQHSDQINL